MYIVRQRVAVSAAAVLETRRFNWISQCGFAIFLIAAPSVVCELLIFFFFLFTFGISKYTSLSKFITTPPSLCVVYKQISYIFRMSTKIYIICCVCVFRCGGKCAKRHCSCTSLHSTRYIRPIFIFSAPLNLVSNRRLFQS